MAITWHDAMVTCFEAEYHWWRIRPFQAQLAADATHPLWPASSLGATSPRP
jgi:hypothetical protein